MQLIPTKTNTKTITDLREDALGVIQSASDHGLIYINYKSKPQTVMLDINHFVQLMHRLEELEEIAQARTLAKQPRGQRVSLDEIKTKYL